MCECHTFIDKCMCVFFLWYNRDYTMFIYDVLFIAHLVRDMC